VVQVEIDRALYMDEKRLKPSDQFEPMRNLMTEAVRRVCEWTRGEARVAAE
jgi:N-formylglutamate amidohydrolase